MAKGVDNRGKRTVYFRPTIIAELQREAIRQDRSISWMMQRAWRLARGEIMNSPSRASVGAPPSALVTLERDVNGQTPKAA